MHYEFSIINILKATAFSDKVTWMMQRMPQSNVNSLPVCCLEETYKYRAI